MPSPDRSLALTRRQDAGRVVAGLSVAGAALAFALLRGVGRSAPSSSSDRRDAEEAGAAGRLEARTAVLRASRRDSGAPQHDAVGPRQAQASAARALNQAAATLAGSVLLDSGVEHYRGMFNSRTMYVPLAVSAAAMAANLAGAAGRGNQRARSAVGAACMLAGLVGLGFHARNVLRREDGLSWQNLFYGAPVGAPAALAIAGALGLAAERVEASEGEPTLAGLPAGRALAAFSALGIAGSSAEAGLLHFRGAFQNPAMFVPVVLPPLAAAALAGAAACPDHPGLRTGARWALRATAAAGVAGVAFHAYGVSRMMGGWSNWSQNLVDGPPLPAPPAFTGLSVAGLAALDLIEAGGG